MPRCGDPVILRPTRLYGPGPLNPANSVTKIIALYRRGLFRVLVRKPASRSLLSTLPWRGGQGVSDRREARANYVYVDDVVAGMLLTAERGTRGAAYLLGGENLTLRELLGLVDEATGTHHGVLPLACPVARTVARLCELGALLGIEPLITRDWLDVLTEDRPMSAAKAQAELGYTPHNARDGVAATVAWLEAGSPGVGIPALKGRLGRSAEAS